MKRIQSNNPELLDIVSQVLAYGGLIIYPTETSYGLGADATNSAAIKKLLEYKGNRFNKALSVAVADQLMAKDYIEMNPTAENIFQTLLPGPVTVVGKSLGNVVSEVESERHTLGLRYSSYPLMSEIVKHFGKPITATSANTSGMKQIFSFSEWQQYVPESRQQLIDVFVDAGPLPVRPPSTVVDTTLNNPEIVRQGELTIPNGATRLQSRNVNETIEIGKKLIEKQMDLLVTQPIVFALQGVLGAGKTQLTKGIASGLQIRETINSPTYMIMHEYPYTTTKISGMLYHLDTWRLFEGETIGDLGVESRIGPGSVIVIEWQQKAREWIEKLKKPIMVAWVDIQVVSENERCLSLIWEART